MIAKLMRDNNQLLFKSCILCHQIYILLTYNYETYKKIIYVSSNHETQSISEHWICIRVSIGVSACAL